MNRRDSTPRSYRSSLAPPMSPTRLVMPMGSVFSGQAAFYRRPSNKIDHRGRSRRGEYSLSCPNNVLAMATTASAPGVVGGRFILPLAESRVSSGHCCQMGGRALLSVHRRRRRQEQINRRRLREEAGEVLISSAASAVSTSPLATSDILHLPEAAAVVSTASSSSLSNAEDQSSSSTGERRRSSTHIEVFPEDDRQGQEREIRHSRSFVEDGDGIYRRRHLRVQSNSPCAYRRPRQHPVRHYQVILEQQHQQQQQKSMENRDSSQLWSKRRRSLPLSSSLSSPSYFFLMFPEVVSKLFCGFADQPAFKEGPMHYEQKENNDGATGEDTEEEDDESMDLDVEQTLMIDNAEKCHIADHTNKRTVTWSEEVPRSYSPAPAPAPAPRDQEHVSRNDSSDCEELSEENAEQEPYGGGVGCTRLVVDASQQTEERPSVYLKLMRRKRTTSSSPSPRYLRRMPITPRRRRVSVSTGTNTGASGSTAASSALEAPPLTRLRRSSSAPRRRRGSHTERRSFFASFRRYSQQRSPKPITRGPSRTFSFSLFSSRRRVSSSASSVCTTSNRNSLTMMPAVAIPIVDVTTTYCLTPRAD